MALDRLTSDVAQGRKTTLEAVHPEYATHAANWTVLLDAFEGSGGFLDGGYLWKYRSEIPSDYDERKAQARYHNFVSSLVDLYVRYILSMGVSRSTSNQALQDWWADVDASGTSMDAFIRQALSLSLATSHVCALVDKTPDPPTGPSRADERARVIATLYPPPSVPDWRMTRGTLTGVKLREALPAGSIAEAPPDDTFRYLLWDTEQWARFTADGSPIEIVDHALGLVPVAVLRPMPSMRSPMLGRALVGQANLVLALLNRMSEEDEVLRGQAFSLFAVEVPSDAAPDEVTATAAAVKDSYGVKRALIMKGRAYRVNADMAGPQQVQSNIQFLIRELFRAAHVPYQTDTQAVKSAESLALEHRELNEMLHGVAAAAQAFEVQLAQFWCQWMSPTADAGRALFEASDVQVSYPREFFTGTLLEDLQALGTAITEIPSDLFKKHIQKKLVRRVDPDLGTQDQALLEQIDGEIDAAKDQAADPQALLAAATARLSQRPQTMPADMRTVDTTQGAA